MLAKMARSAPRSPFGVPRMTAIVRAAKRSCRNAAKAQKFTTVRGSSGESRLSGTEVGRRIAPSSPQGNLPSAVTSLCRQSDKAGFVQPGPNFF